VTFLRTRDVTPKEERDDPLTFNDPSLYPLGYIDPRMVGTDGNIKTNSVTIKYSVVEETLDPTGSHLKTLEDQLMDGNFQIRIDGTDRVSIARGLDCCNSSVNDETDIRACVLCGGGVPSRPVGPTSTPTHIAQIDHSDQIRCAAGQETASGARAR
jgi:hypothetical protein